MKGFLDSHRKKQEKADKELTLCSLVSARIDGNVSIGWSLEKRIPLTKIL